MRCRLSGRSPWVDCFRLDALPFVRPGSVNRNDVN